MAMFIKGICKADEPIHTRVGACSMFEGTPLGFIITDKTKTFTAEEVAFNTYIKTGITALGINRITPLLGGFVDLSPTGGDVATSQEGWGEETPIKNNALREDYTKIDGGLCQFKQLKKLNGRQIRIFLVDMNNVAYGTSATIGGISVFRGFLATLWFTRRKNVGTTPGAIIMSIFYSTQYENEEAALGSLPLTENYEGLTGVVLKRVGVGRAKFVIACSGDDLTSTFGATLGSPTLYANDSGVPPTTVVYTPATEDLTFTPAAAKYRILDAMTLSVASIDGYEGESEYTDLT